jgi:hypothetical protein
MTNPQTNPSEASQDRFGRQVAARLSAATAELPYNVSERLRAARVQAIARRKPAVVPTLFPVRASGGTATLGFGNKRVSLWRQVATALPLIVLAAGLILIHTVQNDWRATEVAEVDAALLTDDLPPSAYADPGFVQFLKSSRD